jgi:hypothetical protein
VYIVLEISIIVASTFLNLAFMSISTIIQTMGEMLDLNSHLHEIISRIVEVEGITIYRLGQLERGLKTKKLPKTKNLG